jgi:hypothetical protein
MNVGPQVPVYLTMIWLPLGLLVTVVYLVVYGIAYKRRGLIVAGGSILAVIVAGLLLMSLNFVPRSISATSISFGSDMAPRAASADRAEGNIPRIDPTFSGGAFHAGGWRISFGKLFIVSILAMVAIQVFSRRGQPREVSDRRCGWGLGRLILLALVVMFALRLWNSTSEQNAHQWSQNDKRQAERARRDVEQSRRMAAVATIPAPAEIQANIEQLWDQLNRPKIDLHTLGKDGIAVPVIAAPPNVEIKTSQPPSTAQVKKVAAGANSTENSFTQSAAGLGHLLAEISTIAMRVADTSKFISRTLVAMDSPAEEPAATPTPFANMADAAKLAPARKSTTNAKPVVAKVDHKESSDATSDLNEKIGGELPSNKPRPAWVDEPQKLVGNVFRQVLVAGPYATSEECSAKTDELLKMATDNYVKRFIANTGDDRPLVTVQEGSPSVKITNFRSAALEQMGIDLSYIRREIARDNDEYFETVGSSVGPMKNLYTRLEFTPEIHRELKTRWDELQRVSRVTTIGLLSGSILGVIGLAFGLLKVDTATKGYYSKRLFLGVPAAIIGLGILATALAHVKH